MLEFTNNPTFICIDNKDIDTLLFMTDGVHERVDPKELVMIVNKYSDRKRVVEAILEAANKNSPKRKKPQEPKRKGLFQGFFTSNKSDGNDGNYIDSIPAGGDNLTVAGIDISQEDSEQSGPEM